MPSRQLAKNTYQKLLDEIAGIYDSALKDARLAVEAILKTAYWKIGQRVVETEQDGHIRAAYGSHLLEHISKDMSKTNRKGFSVSNLKNMRQVYATFSIRQLTGELGWTHFVTLSVIKDKKERQDYLEKAAAKKWTVEELKNVLLRDQVKTIPSDNGAVKRLAARVARVIDGDTPDPPVTVFFPDGRPPVKLKNAAEMKTFYEGEMGVQWPY